MSFLHRLKHLLGLHKGHPFSFYDREKLMMGFKCGECGDIEKIHTIDNLIDRSIHDQQDKIAECRCTCHCHFQTADKELLEDNPNMNKCHNEADVTDRYFPDFCEHCNNHCIE